MALPTFVQVSSPLLFSLLVGEKGCVCVLMGHGLAENVSLEDGFKCTQLSFFSDSETTRMTQPDEGGGAGDVLGVVWWVMETLLAG